MGGTLEDLICMIRYGWALSMILIDGGEVDEDSSPCFIHTKLTPRHIKYFDHDHLELQLSVVH